MKKVKWITTTAVMIALLITLQSITKAGGQFVTGSCVNLVLIVAALIGGMWSGVTVALLSPFFAFLLGIGPQFLQIVPAIAAGNLVYVLLLSTFLKKLPPQFILGYVAVAVSAAGKFLTLWALVTRWIAPLVVPAAKLPVISAMFSWPQLVTALIGGCLAVMVVPMVRKGLRQK